jgi:hypothetical protein
MWRLVQEFDITWLVLTEIEGDLASRDQWEHEMHFFYPLDEALHQLDSEPGDASVCYHVAQVIS